VVADYQHLPAYDGRTGRPLRRWLMGRVEDFTREASAVAEEINEQFQEYGPEQIAGQLRGMYARLGLPDRQLRDVVSEVQRLQQQMVATLGSDDWLDEHGLQGSEQVLRVVFDPVRDWLVCGTSQGVRIYDWDGLWNRSQPVESDAGSKYPRFVPPPPILAAEGKPYREEGEEANQDLPDDNSIHALACDAAGHRLIYAGAGGVIEGLDLNNGRSHTLVEVPGRPTIHALHFSRDGSSLACVTYPQVSRDTPQLTPELYIRNYPALLASIGEMAK
jgi:hypothetical protein